MNLKLSLRCNDGRSILVLLTRRSSAKLLIPLKRNSPSNDLIEAFGVFTGVVEDGLVKRLLKYLQQANSVRIEAD